MLEAAQLSFDNGALDGGAAKWLTVEKESAWELESLTKSRAHGCLNRSGLAATVAVTWQYMCKKHALSLVTEKVMSSYRPRPESDFCGGCFSASEFLRQSYD